MLKPRALAVILFVLLLIVLSEVTGVRELITVDYIRSFVSENPLLGFVIFCSLFTLANLVQIPGIIFLAGAVLAFGKVQGGVFTYGAATLSCVICFLIIRLLGKDSLRTIKYKWAQRVLKQMDQRPIVSVVLLRIIFQTAPVLNYSLALSGLKFREHLIGTALGLPLPIAVYCIFFDQLVARLL